MSQRFGSTWLFLNCILFLIYVVVSGKPKNEFVEIKFVAFNIQSLGLTKVRNETILEQLEQILIRYDVIAITELQDKSQVTASILQRHLNKKVSIRESYAMVLSDRVGRYPGEIEQYVIYYRPEVVRFLRNFSYQEINDEFSRDPFIAEFRLQPHGSTKSIDVAVVVLHAKPDNTETMLTVKEIDALADVYDFIRIQKNIKNTMFLGDFNAGGRYIRKSDWSSIRLRSRPEFQWLIDDNADTTVGNSTVAYDRIVVAGQELQDVIEDARVYRFDNFIKFKGRKMTPKQAMSVSDHYPVEVTLRIRK